MKECRECKIVKEDSDFYKGCRKCKSCKIKYQKSILNPEKRKKYVKEYYSKNKEEQIALSKEYYRNNSDKIKENSKKNYSNNRDKKLEYQKQYQQNNKVKRNSYLSNRKKNDPVFKLKCLVYRIIGESINYQKRVKRSSEILGCSIEEFKIYLENRFEPWMTWENHGLYNGELNYGWDIDHIIPLSSAKSEEDVLKLSHYTNLQPLCSKINRDIKKSGESFYLNR